MYRGTNLQKALGVGKYAPVVIAPSADGSNIAKAVETLGLTGVQINGIIDEHKQDAEPGAKPQPEKLPPQFVNISTANGRWYVDRVDLKRQHVESVAMRSTYIAAKRFASGYAGRMDLPTHEGPYTLPAVEEPKPAPAPTEDEIEEDYREKQGGFGFSHDELEKADYESERGC